MADIESCAHYWIIGTPKGPTSVGICKLCSAEREFRNSMDVVGWEKESPSERNRNPLPATTRRQVDEEAIS